MLSAAVAVVVTLPATVALFAGAVTDTVGAVVSAFCTVTATDDDVVVLPARSRATAVSVCGPSGTCAVFQLTLNGEVVSSAPRLFAVELELDAR